MTLRISIITGSDLKGDEPCTHFIPLSRHWSCRQLTRDQVNHCQCEGKHCTEVHFGGRVVEAVSK